MGIIFFGIICDKWSKSAIFELRALLDSKNVNDYEAKLPELRTVAGFSLLLLEYLHSCRNPTYFEYPTIEGLFRDAFENQKRKGRDNCASIRSNTVAGNKTNHRKLAFT